MPQSAEKLADNESPSYRSAISKKQAITDLLLVVLYIVAAIPFAYLFKSVFFLPGVIIFSLVVCSLLLKWRGQTWRELGLRRPEKLWVAGLWVIGGYLFLALTLTLVQLFLKQFELGTPDYQVFADLPGNLFLLFMWLIPVSWGAAAFGEEMLLRGFVLNRLAVIFGGNRLAWILAATTQAVVFGLGHLYQGWAGFYIATTVGLVMSLIYLLNKRNLWPIIIIHGLVDTFAILAIYLGVIKV